MFSFFDGSKLPAEVSIFFIAPIAWDQNGPNPKNPRKLKKVAESLLTVSATPVIVLSFGPPLSQRATSILKNICTYCQKAKLFTVALIRSIFYNKEEENSIEIYNAAISHVGEAFCNF